MTSGDGTFNGTTIPDAIYYPGNNDKLNKSFNLTLTANASSPCTASASDVIHITLEQMTQIAEQSSKDDFILFPNPARETLKISFPENNGLVADLTLFDNTGRVVLHTNATVTGKSDFLVDVSTLAKGVYFLQVKRAKSTGIQKVVIE